MNFGNCTVTCYPHSVQGHRMAFVMFNGTMPYCRWYVLLGLSDHERNV